MASEEDNQESMIRWLKGQPPDVRHYVTGLLNWDNCERVLEWIATQDDCDAATARAIFWGCDPVALLSRPQTQPIGPYARLASLVCQRFSDGLYAETGLGDSTENLMNQSRKLRSALASRQAPPLFTPPTDFFELHTGRTAQVPSDSRTENNPELRRLLWNLGTDASPPSAPSPPPSTQNRRNMSVRLLWLGLAVTLAAGAVAARCSDRKPRPASPRQAQ